MPKDLTKPEVIKFLNEAYYKEKYIRAHWNKKHKDELKLAATLQREPTNYYQEEVIKHNMIAGLATITRDHASASYNKRKTPIRDARTVPGIESIRHDHSITSIGLGNAKEDPRLDRPDNDLSLDPIMRPVDSKINQLLYKTIPNRERYLTERVKLMPEERYYLPECTNWDYGWRMSDSKLQYKSEYARTWHLHRILSSRVRPTPDPPHYQVPKMSNYSKCAQTMDQTVE